MSAGLVTHAKHPDDVQRPLCGKRGRNVFLAAASPEDVYCRFCLAKLVASGYVLKAWQTSTR